MSKKEKILLIILLIIITLFISVIILYNLLKNNYDDSENNNNIIKNTNQNVISDKEISKVLFSNIKYTYDGEVTTLFMDITNKNEKTIIISHFIIKAYDENNDLIGEFHPVCKSKINPNEQLSQFEVFIKNNLIHAYSIEFELPELEFVEKDIENND